MFGHEGSSTGRLQALPSVGVQLGDQSRRTYVSVGRVDQLAHLVPACFGCNEVDADPTVAAQVARRG